MIRISNFRSHSVTLPTLVALPVPNSEPTGTRHLFFSCSRAYPVKIFCRCDDVFVSRPGNEYVLERDCKWFARCTFRREYEALGAESDDQVLGVRTETCQDNIYFIADRVSRRVLARWPRRSLPRSGRSWAEVGGTRDWQFREFRRCASRVRVPTRVFKLCGADARRTRPRRNDESGMTRWGEVGRERTAKWDGSGGGGGGAQNRSKPSSNETVLKRKKMEEKEKGGRNKEKRDKTTRRYCAVIWLYLALWIRKSQAYRLSIDVDPNTIQ